MKKSVIDLLKILLTYGRNMLAWPDKILQIPTDHRKLS